jgi:hypothetical protein
MFAHPAPRVKVLSWTAAGVAVVLGVACDDGTPGNRQVGVGLGRDAGIARPDAAPPSDASPPAPAFDAGADGRRPPEAGASADAAPRPDLGEPPFPDARATDDGTGDGFAPADAMAVPPEVDGRSADTTVSPPVPPDAAPAAVCGNGVLEPGEGCDDGELRVGCDTHHDGGDGVCRPAGRCSETFELAPDGTCRAFEPARGVDIFVDNFCAMDVRPPEVHVPPGAGLQVTWYNRSVDYPVDVWLSYGGGFLDLEPGTSWADRFEFCRGGQRPYQAYADISTACSEHRFLIWCD